MSLRAIAEDAGFDSHNYAVLRAPLKALVDIKIEWNLLDFRGRKQWGICAFLAEAVIDHGSGTCRYAYPPTLRGWLYHPEMYGRINLSVQKRFGSTHALALYENCVRFRAIGTTGWRTVETWRTLLGVAEGTRNQFKHLNNAELKPAVREVNAYSDILVEMDVRRFVRRIDALRFQIAEKVQFAATLEKHQARVNHDAQITPTPPRALLPETNGLWHQLRILGLTMLLVLIGVSGIFLLVFI